MKMTLHGLLSAIEKNYRWASSTEVDAVLATIDTTSVIKDISATLHKESVKFATQYTKLPQPLRDTIEECFSLDSLYDRKLAGLYSMLTAVSTTTDNRLLSETLLHTRNTLFPEGILGETYSYLRQESYVIVSNMRISIEARELLKGITYNGCNLLDDFTEWVFIGKRLGVLEKIWERQLDAYDVSALSPPELRNLRITWRNLLDETRSIIGCARRIAQSDRVRLLGDLTEIENLYRVEIHLSSREPIARARTGTE